jgi:hypothetical protein
LWQGPLADLIPQLDTAEWTTRPSAKMSAAPLLATGGVIDGATAETSTTNYTAWIAGATVLAAVAAGAAYLLGAF